MSKVRTHTRVVNGRRQKVKSHSRKLQPSRARANLRQASRHRRRGSYGPAAACAAVAVAEIGGWVALRGVGVALVTVGIVALGLGVAARRATPSSPAASVRRSAGTVRPVPQRSASGRPVSVRRPAGPDRSTRSGYRQQQYDRSSPSEREQQDEFYRLREVEGYKGPIRWDKGQMPRKADGS